MTSFLEAIFFAAGQSFAHHTLSNKSSSEEHAANIPMAAKVKTPNIFFILLIVWLNINFKLFGSLTGMITKGLNRIEKIFMLFF